MIGRRSLIILVARLISSALAFVGLFFITRYIGATAYGSITWTLALVATFFALSDLGFGSAHIKRLNEKLSADDCVSTYAAIKVVLVAVTLLVTTVSIVVWEFALGGSVTRQTSELIVLFMLYQVFYALSNIATFTYQGTMETFKAQLVTLVDPFIRVPLVIFVALASPTMLSLAYTYVLGGLAVVIASLLILHRDHFKWQRPTLYRSYLLFAAPLIIVTIIGTVNGYMDDLMIGFFGNKTDVAYYTSSQVFLSVVGIMSGAVATLTYPSFSKLHTEGSMGEIRSLTYQAERYLAMFSFPVIAVIVVFATPVAIIFYGASFAPAGLALQFLAVSTLLGIMNQVHASQILAVNRPDIQVRITFLNFVVFAVLLFLLVPDGAFGVQLAGLSYEGAAIANMATAILIFLVTRLVVYRLTGTGLRRRLAIQVFAMLVTAGLVYLLQFYRPMTNVVWLLFYGVVALVAYFGVLALLREFTQKDFDYFVEVLNITEMAKYVRDEIHNEERGKI